MDTSLLVKSKRADIKSIINIKNTQNILLLKTLNELPIIIKYTKGRTPVRNLINLLDKKINYNCSCGDKYDRIDKMVLLFNNIILDNLDKDLSEYGISNVCETISMKRKDDYNINSDNVNSKELLLSLKERSKGSNTNQLFIKTLTGKTITINAPDDISVIELKSCCMEKEGIPPSQQRLIYSGNQMENNELVKNYLKKTKLKLHRDTINEMTIHMVLCLRGGMFNEVSGRNGEYKPLQNVLTQIYTIRATNRKKTT